MSGNGQVFYQGGVLRTTCNDTTAISYIINLVNTASRAYYPYPPVFRIRIR